MTSYDNHQVLVTGSGWIESAQSHLFVPRLNNAYEQYLFEEAYKASGIEYWHVKKFDESSGLPHMQAMESAFNEAVASAGLQRKIKKKNGNRVGVIYFDQYGPISFMERKAQIKEMYYSDVFPSFVLQAHNISGYSVRLRAERNAAMQAMELAKGLIEDGTLDVVFVGGINPCYSFFFLSEELETRKWEKQQGVRVEKSTSERKLSEAAGFIVLESASHAQQRGVNQCQTLVDVNPVRENYSAKKAAEYPFIPTWKKMAQTHEVEKVYMGLYPSTFISNNETMLLNDFFPNAEMVNVYDKHGDANSLNVLRVLHDNQQSIGQVQSTKLIHSTDRSGFGWNLLIK